MELLETQDPEKKKLLELSERHRKELQKEVQDISQRTERVLTNALIVGGVLALSYFAVSQFSKGRSKKKKHKKERQAEDNGSVIAGPQEEVMAAAATPSLMSEIGTKVLNQATMILVELAREKLMEYLQSRKKDDNS
jgi:hypothetical protein